MATYPSDEQSLSHDSKENDPNTTPPAEQNLEKGGLDHEDRGEEDNVGRTSPRSVHGISVCKAHFSIFYD